MGGELNISQELLVRLSREQGLYYCVCERIATLQPLGCCVCVFFYARRSEAIGLEIRRDSKKRFIRVPSSSRMAGAESEYELMGAKGKASEASQALYFRVVETIRFSSA